MLAAFGRQKPTKNTVKQNKKIETGRFQGGVAYIYIAPREK
jgi:hypothetical protein